MRLHTILDNVAMQVLSQVPTDCVTAAQCSSSTFNLHSAFRCCADKAYAGSPVYPATPKPGGCLPAANTLHSHMLFRLEMAIDAHHLRIVNFSVNPDDASAGLTLSLARFRLNLQQAMNRPNPGTVQPGMSHIAAKRWAPQTHGCSTHGYMACFCHDV